MKRLTALTAALAIAYGSITVPAVAQEEVAGVAAAPQPGFRVKPYLMPPSASTMTINWFSETGTAATIIVNGPDGEAHAATVTGEYQEHLRYTDAELNQQITGLEQGSWLKSDDNYKHQINLEDLEPDTDYTYTVTQDGVTYTNTFSTHPESAGVGGVWEDFTVAAFSDSETEPAGRPAVSGAREWEAPGAYAPGSETRPGEGSKWFDKFGSNVRQGQPQPRYPLTQDQAMMYNMQAIEALDPAMLLVAGDLTQGSGYQPAWDEFWRYSAGELGEFAGARPLVTALGNWETYAAINGGYGESPTGLAHGAAKGRTAYQTYIDTFGSDNEQHQDSYHRVDYGPLTVITMDSTNGTPESHANDWDGQRIEGNDLAIEAAGAIGTDTNQEYTQAGIHAAGATDQPDFVPGSDQWNWVEKQLADARAAGQIIVIQFHHSAYSSGVHGTAHQSATPDGQPGTPLRVYTPMFEKYGVATVISGHDEMFERSFVDMDGDGAGVTHYDVGVAADGLRGEYMVLNEDTGEYEPIGFNTYSEWTAQADSPELWQTDANGTLQLIDGGKHYGHLQMDFSRAECTNYAAEITMSPVYLFPVLDSDYNLVNVERRVYDDVQTIRILNDGSVAPRNIECQVTGDDTPPGSRADSSSVGGMLVAVLAILGLIGAGVYAFVPNIEAQINALLARLPF